MILAHDEFAARFSSVVLTISSTDGAKQHKPLLDGIEDWHSVPRSRHRHAFLEDLLHRFGRFAFDRTRTTSTKGVDGLLGRGDAG